MQAHLDLKEQLTNPKKGDVFTTEYYLEGWRNCTITIGSKWATVKPLFGRSTPIKMSVKSMKKTLHDMYWNSAATAAHYKAVAEGRKKKANNWSKDY